MSMLPFSRTTFATENGSFVLAIYLPVEPFGVALFVASDRSSDSRKLIEDIVPQWPVLWPAMKSYLETEIEAYGVEVIPGHDGFMGSLQRLTPDVFMGDQSDALIRLEFDEPPCWDFFICGHRLVHAQPVF